MSAYHSLKSHSPLKSVCNKIGGPYQTYINSHNTHAMATCHRGTGEPLEEALAPHEHDCNIPSEYHSEDMDNFDNVEHEHHTTLKTLTRGFNSLCHRV